MTDDPPALLGGPPVRPAARPDWPRPDPAVRDALEAAFADGSWGQYLGPNVPQLEAALATFHKVEHAVTCASGTLAVEVALRALGVGPGDEVILAAYDFEPTFLCVHALGARPVLVDVAPKTATIDAANLRAAVSPTTKAIVATHLHGSLVPMAELMAVAAELGIRVVEDAAQVIGATVQGKPAGSWGDVGVLSFGGSKLLTAGRGGAILTPHADIHQRLRLALARGIQQWAPLSELQAAVLLPQLSALPHWTSHRRERVLELVDLLKDVPGLRPFADGPPASVPAYYKLGFFLDESAFGLSREVFVKALRAEGMAFDAGFRPLHVGRASGRYRAAGPLANAETAGRSVVMLHHPVLSLNATDVGQVAEAVWKTYRNAARLR
jgi:dTDP-4-amino-4,6-dideoxygalactose transaminase